MISSFEPKSRLSLCLGGEIKDNFSSITDWCAVTPMARFFCHCAKGSKNCVYLVTCKRCGIQYVGETGNTLLIRFTQHRYNITRKKNTHTHLVKHFLLHGWDSVTATVIQINSRWATQQRWRAERMWIAKLNTVYPHGLNEKGFRRY